MLPKPTGGGVRRPKARRRGGLGSVAKASAAERLDRGRHLPGPPPVPPDLLQLPPPVRHLRPVHVLELAAAFPQQRGKRPGPAEAFNGHRCALGLPPTARTRRYQQQQQQ